MSVDLTRLLAILLPRVFVAGEPRKDASDRPRGPAA